MAELSHEKAAELTRAEKKRELTEAQELLTAKYGKKYTAVPTRKLKALGEFYENKIKSANKTSGAEKLTHQNEYGMLRVVLTYFLGIKTEKELSDHVKSGKERAKEVKECPRKFL